MSSSYIFDVTKRIDRIAGEYLASRRDGDAAKLPRQILTFLISVHPIHHLNKYRILSSKWSYYLTTVYENNVLCAVDGLFAVVIVLIKVDLAVANPFSRILNIDETRH